ncbi:hypothetical protein K2173_003266 [Erythroxylum novogranatense]|uniref:Uncharacterized protein n=1 Tax=Erythroxylum novogranatense TaxID=1862640 RepID=A0AAV8SXJ5_9ROSI|nr:hypothetical protein K2173_003266 [Erythroxylum novogranatense]
MALYGPVLFHVSASPTLPSPVYTPSNNPPLYFRSSSVFLQRTVSIGPVRASPTTQSYVYPDPVPEFAQYETQKFRRELLKKLSEDKETFGVELHKVVDICSEIFSEFLNKEYGGPGAMMIEPFTDMLIALKENRLPGAPLAARVALLWAQNYVDLDWEHWNSKPSK